MLLQTILYLFLEVLNILLKNIILLMLKVEKHISLGLLKRIMLSKQDFHLLKLHLLEICLLLIIVD